MSENENFICGKKIDYKSKETAKRSATRMNEKGRARNPLEAYQCKYCQGWHIGRKKTPWKRIRKLYYNMRDWITGK